MSTTLMSTMPARIAAFAMLATLVACGRESQVPAPTAPTVTIPGDTNSSGCPGTVTETLSGQAINGVRPEGQARADESRFCTGGSTILTVQIKNVNLPDGTVVNVSLDFNPVGTITLGRGEGSLVASLGHFAVSNDEVRVSNNGTVILSGPFFR